ASAASSANHRAISAEPACPARAGASGRARAPAGRLALLQGLFVLRRRERTVVPKRNEQGRVAMRDRVEEHRKRYCSRARGSFYGAAPGPVDGRFMLRRAVSVLLAAIVLTGCATTTVSIPNATPGKPLTVPG